MTAACVLTCNRDSVGDGRVCAYLQQDSVGDGRVCAYLQQDSVGDGRVCAYLQQDSVGDGRVCLVLPRLAAVVDGDVEQVPSTVALELARAARRAGVLYLQLVGVVGQRPELEAAALVVEREEDDVGVAVGGVGDERLQHDAAVVEDAHVLVPPWPGLYPDTDGNTSG